MRTPHGFSVWRDRESEKVICERDTFQCCHCGRHVDVPPRESPSYMCGPCHAPVCGPCHARGNCVPQEKMIEAIERDGKRRAAVDSILRAAGIE